jgi:hypothetical protein
MSDDPKDPQSIDPSEVGDLSSVIGNLMDPISVPEMGIPVDGTQKKTYPDSTNVFCVEYTFPTRELLVEFANGGVYRYSDVPVEIWRGFQRADSAGKFLAAEVRGKFKSAKVELAPSTTDFPEL